jgi:ABC-type antimicrobial peptide transport system permease subunit
MVVADSLLPAMIGAAGGTAAAISLAGLLAHLVFGITSRDPATFLGVVGALTAAAAVSSYLPARRASRLDPTVALRAE